MNQHASDAPQENQDESTGHGQPAGPSEQPAASDEQPVVSDEPVEVVDEPVEVVDEPAAPIVAELVQAAQVRRGSPFAIDPVTVRPVDNFVDMGPIRYTAMGAVAASILVLAFAAAATWWFPAGGTLIAALGCVLSIFGLYSTHKLISAGLLAVHLSLFVVCYGLSLS